MRRVFSLIVTLATLLIICNKTVVNTAGPAIPRGAVLGGWEADGRDIYICVATVPNGRYREYPALTDSIPGKFTGGQCLYNRGDSFERVAPAGSYRILTSTTRLVWGPPRVVNVTSPYPEIRQELGGAFWAGTANYVATFTGSRYGGKLYSCRADIGGGKHPGFTNGSGTHCRIPYGGGVRIVTDFEALTDPNIPFSYWTGWHSEESAQPAVCSPVGLLTGFGCRERFCDEVRLNCLTRNLVVSRSWWSREISEETDNTCLSIGGDPGFFDCNRNVLSCGSSGFITGISCSGDFCDNVKMQCSNFEGYTRIGGDTRYCQWTGWVSEEGGGTLTFPRGFYGAGMECKGSNCDEKRFYVCRLVPSRR